MNIQHRATHAERLATGSSARALLKAKWCLLAAHFTLAAMILVLPATGADGAPLISTNLPPISTPLPDASFSVFRVFGALALVLALFLGGVWCYKNWQRLAVQRGGRQPQLQLLEVKSLGARHALYVVGYQSQRLLLASSPAGITLVSHLPEKNDASEAALPSSGDPNFAETLQHLLQRK
jgi:flagellar biogenesis protein FliO